MPELDVVAMDKAFDLLDGDAKAVHIDHVCNVQRMFLGVAIGKDEFERKDFWMTVPPGSIRPRRSYYASRYMRSDFYREYDFARR